MKLRQTTYESGQTLLELIIALGVVAVVITALVSAVTSSLRFGDSSRLRSRGVKVAQEGIELSRKLRDTNTWATFQGYSGTGTEQWCLDGTGAWTLDDGTGECPLSAESPLWRVVTFYWNDPIMEATVDVSWGERTEGSTVSLKTFFTEWK